MKHVNNKGFSLIELMIVVAIIGILATVAIPNFQKFQGKAKQSEAKSNLGGYYMAQKAFFAEYNFYVGQFGMSGFVPQGQLNYRITAADGSALGTTNLPASMNVAACISSAAPPANAYVCTAPAFGSAGANSLVWGETALAIAPTTAASVGSTTTFTAVASAKLTSAAAHDEWTMTQDNLVTNVIYGL